MENKEKDLESILKELMEWCKKYNEDFAVMSVVDGSGYANTDPHIDNYINITIGENNE